MHEKVSKKIVISGYYGFHNSGDEAVLCSILHALEAQAKKQNILLEPIVLSNHPKWTFKTYGVRAVHRMRIKELMEVMRESDGLISGGGSLLQDVTSSKTIPYYLGILKMAQLLKKPTFIYAQGLGPVKRKTFHTMIAHVFRKCAYVSVRDQASYQFLKEMNIEPDHVVPDPVMASESFLPVHNGENKVLGISVRFWNPKQEELKSIAKVAEKCIRELGVHVRLLPFHTPYDYDASKVVQQAISSDYRSRVEIFKPVTTHPHEMLRAVSECDVLLGMRLHSLIYAASQRVPFFGISYDPKVNEFLQWFDMKPVGDTSSISVRKVVDKIKRTLQEAPEWRKKYETSIGDLQQKAQLPAERIVRWIGGESYS